MDDRTFDRFARALGVARNRRVALGLVAGAAGLALGAAAEAADARKHDRGKRRGAGKHGRKGKHPASVSAVCATAGTKACPLAQAKPGANLKACNYASANLAGAAMNAASATAASFAGADLSGANLSGAGLGNACLSGANLSGAGLGNACLSGANLSGAILRGANLQGADLTDANLTGADLRGTNASAAQLAVAKVSCTTILPNGKRSACPAGESCCGNACVDTGNDKDNCGGCGNACAAGKVCRQSACACPAGQVECGGTCVDLRTDPANCGACGTACGGATPVCNGSGACACGDVCASGCQFAKLSAALAATPNNGTIRVCAGRYDNETPGPGQLQQWIIGQNVTIVGAGQGPGGTELASPASSGRRVATVLTGFNVEFRNLAVTGGNCIVTGGGLYVLGTGRLTLTDVTVADNRAAGTLPKPNGGGIANEGTLTLAGQTKVTQNSAEGTGGGVFNDGGTVLLQGAASVTGNTPNDCAGTAAC